MDPVVTIADDDLVVEPGSEVSTGIRVRNTSDIVDQYELSVLGDAAAYAQIVPPLVSAYVGDTIDATVVFRPPYDTSISSGRIPFGIRARSVEHDDRAEVVEGDLTVGSINLIDVKITPLRSAGRWRAKTRVELRNRGTEELTVRLGTVDPEEKLSFALAPKEVDVGANKTAEAFLKIRPRKPIVLGQASHHPYQISYKRRAGVRDAYLGATTGGETEAFADAIFEQKPILAKWMLAVALLALALVGLIVFRAQTADIEVVPENPVPAPQPPAEFTVEADVDLLRLSWTRPDPPPTGYLVRNADPEAYARGILSLDSEPVFELQADQTTATLELPGGATKCLFIQSRGEAEVDGEAVETRSVIVGVASPRGLIDAALPNANCAKARSADQCDPPVITAVDRTGDATTRRVRWQYGEGCADADVSWTVSVNGEVKVTGATPPPDPETGELVLNVTLPEQPIDDFYLFQVSPGPDLNDSEIFRLPATDVEEAVTEAEDAAAEEAAAEEAAQEAEELAEGRYTPSGTYAIVLSHRPTDRFPVTDADLTLTGFLEAMFGLLTSDEAPPTFEVARVHYGPVDEEAVTGGSMEVLNLVGAPTDPRDYYLIVDGFPSVERAQTRVCDAVAGVLGDLIEGDFAEAFPVTDRPDGCRVIPAQ